MNDIMAFPKPKINVGQLLKVVGLPTERERAEKSAAEQADFLRGIIVVVDGLISAAIDQRTAASFASVREEVFPQYVAAVTALGSLTRIVLSKQTIDRISSESFSDMEADFRELGNSTVGADLTERGLFTLWTIRKIYDLGKEIEASEFPKENAKEDSEKAREFVRWGLWSRFHLDCLIKSVRTQKAIYPDVTEPLRDGLRASVNAYAHIRQWADLRAPRVEQEFAMVGWTDDDEMLLADSMRDLDQELSL
jgi:hypothetical protein